MESNRIHVGAVRYRLACPIAGLTRDADVLLAPIGVIIGGALHGGFSRARRSHWTELNRQPPVYKTGALPLSYKGTGVPYRGTTAAINAQSL